MTMAKISQGHISSWLITIPPTREQEEIETFLDQDASVVRGLDNEANSAIALLKERRSALISAAVTGKIDVREFAKSADERT